MVEESSIYRTSAAVGILILILDGKTALTGMQQGIQVCLDALIPSLFPFIVLTSIMTEHINEKSGMILKKVGKICAIPPGTETVLLTGLLGGYPVGARNVASLYQRRCIPRKEAQRLCVLCNNAGPSFLFGILMPLFSDLSTVLLLWIIQILCVLILGHSLPGGTRQPVSITKGSAAHFTTILSGCIRAMASICTWVVLFRMILEFFGKWFMHLLPLPIQVLVTGVLELSNGCLALTRIEDESLRFLLASVMLSFGGICVFMQTLSVCPRELTPGYCRAKIIHSFLSCMLSLAALTGLQYLSIQFVLLFFLFIAIILIIRPENSRNIKKEVAF